MSVDPDRNFVRHVGGLHVQGDLINGSAFERSPKDTDGVSISIRGIFSDDTESDVSQIRKVVGARRKLGKTSVFAELNVGSALSVLHDFDECIQIVLHPLPEEGNLPEDPSHALIEGLPFRNEAVGSLKSEIAGDLLSRQILHIYPAVPAS